jgi:hypothetical protein
MYRHHVFTMSPAHLPMSGHGASSLPCDDNQRKADHGDDAGQNGGRDISSSFHKTSS